MNGFANRTRGRFVGDNSLSAWVCAIAEAWTQGAAGTLELARIVAKARANLEYGEWSQLWRSGDIPFSKRKAEMLVVIGEAVEGLDAQNSAHLPVAWNTLYYLARLGTALMLRLIDEGRIHPDISLREAQELLAEFRPPRGQKKPGLKIEERLARFAEFVRSTLPKWTAAERRLVHAELSSLVDELAFGGLLQASKGHANNGHEFLRQKTDLRQFSKNSPYLQNTCNQ